MSTNANTGRRSGLDFSRTFARTSDEGAVAPTNNRKPAAQYWLNFGYFVNEGTDAEKFVSLPMGMPLDTMDKVSTKSSNAEYAQFQAARNDLLEQFMGICGDLEPGDSHIIRTEGDLAIQLRRVNEEAAAPATDESNPFARPGLFAVKTAA